MISRRDAALQLGATLTTMTMLQNKVSAAAFDNRFALLDPELLPFAMAMPQLSSDTGNLAAVRASAVPPPLPLPAPQPITRMIGGPKGSPDVRLVLIDGTDGGANHPAFLNMHGGGFIAGNVMANMAYLQTIAQACRCLVVSVDYRLSPETRFPGALEDNYAALLWLYHNAKSLGVDAKRIAIGGGSAGGGHAAMLAIAARDRGEVPIAFQLLIYPMLDDRTASTRTPPSQVGRFVWTPALNRFGWESLLGQAPGLPQVPEGSVPARVADLSNLPPTFIGVGALDLFVDEDIDYARRLVAAGVPTELLVVPGAFHAFNSIAPKAQISRRFDEAALAALKRGFGIA